jgi:Sap, sulfolipid-1-addressing protein
MGAVIGDLLPLAVGVAISPIPIIAIILMLLAPKAGRASTGFGFGWLLGIVVVTTLVLLVAGGTAGASTGGPSAGVSWVKLVLGLLLLGVGVKQWRDRPKPGDETPLPKWMAAIDKVTPVRATALGFAL